MFERRAIGGVRPQHRRTPSNTPSFAPRSDIAAPGWAKARGRTQNYKMALTVSDFSQAAPPAVFCSIPAVLTQRAAGSASLRIADRAGAAQEFPAPPDAPAPSYQGACLAAMQNGALRALYPPWHYTHTLYAAHTTDLRHATHNVREVDDDNPGEYQTSRVPVPPVILPPLEEGYPLRSTYRGKLVYVNLEGCAQGEDQLRAYFRPGMRIALSGCSAAFVNGALVLFLGPRGAALPCDEPHWPAPEFAPGPALWDAAEELCRLCLQGAHYRELLPRAERLWAQREQERSPRYDAQDPRTLRWWLATSPDMYLERLLLRGKAPEPRIIHWLRQNHDTPSWRAALAISKGYGALPLAVLRGAAPDPVAGLDLWHLPGGAPRFEPAVEEWLRAEPENEDAAEVLYTPTHDPPAASAAPSAPAAAPPAAPAAAPPVPPPGAAEAGSEPDTEDDGESEPSSDAEEGPEADDGLREYTVNVRRAEAFAQCIIDGADDDTRREVTIAPNGRDGAQLVIDFARARAHFRGPKGGVYVPEDGHVRVPLSRRRTAEEIARINADPLLAVKQAGGARSTCCFCERPLEVGESVERGYGPVCAKVHHLPWSGTRQHQAFAHIYRIPLEDPDAE